MPWWGWLIIAIIGLALFITIIVIFIKKGYGKRLKEWLVYAVAEAEKELGGGTGELKLRAVYDKFISRFPIVSIFISFNVFSKLVDTALATLKNLLSTNDAIKNYIEPEQQQAEEPEIEVTIEEEKQIE